MGVAIEKTGHFDGYAISSVLWFGSRDGRMTAMSTPGSVKPGDAILDRYLPNAEPGEREAARQNLRALFAVLIRIAERIARDQSPGTDSRPSSA